MKTKLNSSKNIKKIVSVVLVIIMTLMLVMLDTGAAIPDPGNGHGEAAIIATETEKDPRATATSLTEEDETGEEEEDELAEAPEEGEETPMRAPMPGVEEVVINIGASPIAPGAGYQVNASGRTITFAAAANAYTYKIIQNGSPSTFTTINVGSGFNTTMTLVDVNMQLYMILSGNAKLKLLLDGSNTFNKSYITVPNGTEITIDSAASQGTGSTDGELNIINESITNAGIGGTGTSASGLITINGGTLGITQPMNANNIESAGIGGGARTAGEVIINGGSVSVTQTFIGSDSRPRYFEGALIGGGSGSSGSVLITGGIVNVKAFPNSIGAGIGSGGGKADVTITGGIVTAEIATGSNSSSGRTGTGAAIGSGGGVNGSAEITITGGHITATSRTGAAIGAGERSSNAIISITGGTIIARSNSTGASIGGGGGPEGTGGASSAEIEGAVQILISGGFLNVSASRGACIGNGGYNDSTTPGTGNGLKGKITISGGSIFADHNRGSAIGTGQNHMYSPELWIQPNADIMAFGSAISNFSSIYAGEKEYANNGQNKGDGYYVNANFELNKGASAGLFLVYADEDLTKSPIRIAEIPYAFHQFAYTTGGASRIDYVYTGTFSDGLTQIRRKVDQGNIYSVNETYKYYDNKHTLVEPLSYWRALTVEYGVSNDFKVYFPVTGHHIDTNGNTIKEDTITLVPYNELYEAIPLSIKDYVYKGYKWDTKPIGSNYNPWANGDPIVTEKITESREIYFVYEYSVEYDVNVYYVDEDGEPIGDPEFDTYRVSNNADFILATADIPKIGGYEYAQWKIGINGTPIDSDVSEPTLMNVQADADIYLIYREKPAAVDLTITKTVTGAYSNKSLPFKFSVQFTDDSGTNPLAGDTIAVEGGVISGFVAEVPSFDPLVVIEDNSITTIFFDLKHGQTITIKDVPKHLEVTIVETVNMIYTPSITDSKTNTLIEEGVADITITFDDETERTISYVNTRNVVVPTGVEIDSRSTVLFSMVAIALTLTSLILVGIMKKRASAPQK